MISHSSRRGLGQQDTFRTRLRQAGQAEVKSVKKLQPRNTLNDAKTQRSVCLAASALTSPAERPIHLTSIRHFAVECGSEQSRVRHRTDSSRGELNIKLEAAAAAHSDCSKRDLQASCQSKAECNSDFLASFRVFRGPILLLDCVESVTDLKTITPCRDCRCGF